jgi:hypothetical protein
MCLRRAPENYIAGAALDRAAVHFQNLTSSNIDSVTTQCKNSVFCVVLKYHETEASRICITNYFSYKNSCSNMYLLCGI